MKTAAGAGAATLGRELAHWRKRHGGRGRRIPERLWAEAVRLARRRGVHATARALRLDYERLKVRVGEQSGPAGAGPAPAFVEVAVGSLGSGRTLVELVGRGGEQMRIHLAGTSPAELVGLAQVFWSQQR